MQLVIAFFVTLIVIFSPISPASEKAIKEQELTQLKHKINKLRKTIEVKENSRSSYNRQLRQIEKQIGKLSNQIRSSSQAVKNQQKSLSQLKKRKLQIQHDIKVQNRQLSQQLHAAYTLGSQERTKLLFSQPGATHLQRNLTYYEYFSNYRLKQISLSQKNFERLKLNEQDIIKTKKELERVLSRQKNQKAELGSDRVQRQKIIVSLEKQLKKQGRYLSSLEDDAKNLKSLIDSLSEILTDIPPATKNIKKFSSLKGKLSWPVKGNVNKLFGRTKPPSNLRWQGVVINARQGNNVRAISHGRVAFSDWLRGMGNLIIIDHGDGYLSLYGHNESLFKAAGEWVESGEIIGSIGNSGGKSKPGLYFEIRQKGKPQNPSRWCKSSNWFKTI